MQAYVKRRADLCTEVVFGEMCGSAAAVGVAVALDLPAVVELLSIVIQPSFQTAPVKDLPPLLAGTQLPVTIDLGVVDQASLLFFFVSCYHFPMCCCQLTHYKGVCW